MTDIAVTIADTGQISCSNCQACCCRLEVLLITNTGVAEHYIDTNSWGATVMARLDDGWCAALNRDSFMCTIYDTRPLVCRDFEMAGPECIVERTAHL